ncbi:zinc-dependent alcohol dehydrogenase family protein [Deminuibacter soli]|uniref:NAD(P)-dependent alcohol dehydrogenase n=1 Tax=Deminuibacter soli TaxID=2291815 RepID=A0A3E1NNH4_9BACT|nr:NAD(P)-dependent alcohol dehydrogenase [Deminuibacter soli]RFM29470.1 NAD(P)-dependent alcohol dehydrogenase [Deminuibacter soli]
MKAIQLTGFSIAQLQPAELPIPQPARGEVLIQVKAVSLNYIDGALATGKYPVKPAFPHIPVADGAGVIAAVGEDVTGWQPGDRVVSHFIQQWLGGINTPATNAARTGISVPGMLAEYVVLPAYALLAIPAFLSFEEAASLPIAGVTAWNSLIETGGVTAGQTVLTQGTGGVSLFALQVAKMVGARVIATTGSPEKEAQLKAAGAWEVLNYKTNPQWVQQVLELTGGKGADATIDVAGTVNESAAAVKLGGYVGLTGFLADTSIQLNLLPVISRAIRLQGLSVGSKASFSNFLQALERTNTRPFTSRIFPLAETQEAYHYFQSGKHFGKVIIQP